MAAYEKVATVDLNDFVIKAGAVGTISITASADLVKGTVLDTTGAVLASGKTAAYILAEDAASGDTVGVVYKTGIFEKSALVVADSYALASADIENLRKVGIIVEEAV